MAQIDLESVTRRLAELCVDAYDFVTVFGQSYGSGPEPGSQAETEMHQNGIVGPDGPWSPSVVDTAYTLAAAVFIGAAGQYLMALSQLLAQDEMALFGFQAVARALAESAAHAWWLLDPGIGARERVARTATERWGSIVELGKAEVAAGIDRTIQQGRVLDFRAKMAMLGLDEKLDRRGKLLGYEGHSSPEQTTLVGEFLKSLGATKGEFWYRYSSGVTHTALYAYLQYQDSEAIPGEERAALIAKLPLGAVANAAMLGTMSYLGAVERHALVYGRDAEAVGRERIRTVRAILAEVGAAPGLVDPSVP